MYLCQFLVTRSATTAVHYFLFPTELGAAYLAWRGNAICGLRFGHRSTEDFAPPISGHVLSARSLSADQRDAVARVQAMLQGTPVDFNDLQLEPTSSTPFGRAVVHHCRQIAWGCTQSYADLAAAAGSPAAARAVGNVMRTNPIPLIIPCHRVVGSGNSWGGYSAPGGLTTKQWLLAREANASLKRKPSRRDRPLNATDKRP